MTIGVPNDIVGDFVDSQFNAIDNLLLCGQIGEIGQQQVDTLGDDG
jgi:hypothetical protein